MSTLTLITAGPYSTIQDKGRTGQQALGVLEGGAMDKDALRIANHLVGSEDNAGALELFMGGTRLLVSEARMVSLAGSTADNAIIRSKNGVETLLPSGQSACLDAGAELFVPPLRHTNTVIIAVEGGFDLPPLYGSVATSANAKLGGLDGRLLADGDVLPLGPAAPLSPPPLILSDLSIFEKNQIIRCVTGPQDVWFTAEAHHLFFTSEWGITPQLNRMGFRLTGPALSHKASADILSDGIVCGSIQVPGDGQPIIMMRDHQTTGGYTKMATVISADLAPLARMRPGLSLRFNAISQEEAEDIARQKEDKMRTLLASIRPI